MTQEQGVRTGRNVVDIKCSHVLAKEPARVFGLI